MEDIIDNLLNDFLNTVDIRFKEFVIENSMTFCQQTAAEM
jgi:hypothetical protein